MAGGVLARRRGRGRVEPVAELRPAMIERAAAARARLVELLERDDLSAHQRQVATGQLSVIKMRLRALCVDGNIML